MGKDTGMTPLKYLCVISIELYALIPDPGIMHHLAGDALVHVFFKRRATKSVSVQSSCLHGGSLLLNCVSKLI